MANETIYWAFKKIPNDPENFVTYALLLEYSVCVSLAEYDAQEACKVVISYPIDPTWESYICYDLVKLCAESSA